jgi:hypothetical protein
MIMAEWAYTNCEAASDFIENVEDPIVRSLLHNSYAVMLMSGFHPEGEFDLLHFFRVLEAFLHERERLSRWLLGISSESDRGFGD